MPFGLGRTKPHHYASMLRIAWENRDQASYAWKVLTRGTCDGCALGTIGLRDWTLGPDETHLCMVRLELLRLNTMAAIDRFEEHLADPASLAPLSGQKLRDLGRLPYPMRWRAGEKGYARIGWEEAFAEIGSRIARLEDKDRFALYCTSRGVTNETYYLAQKLARFIGTNNVDNSARLCHSPSTAGLKDTIGVGATTCSYKDWFKSDLIVFLGSNPANDQPVSMKYLHSAKKQGARIVTINTYREPGMQDYWVPSSMDSALFGTHVSDDFVLVHTGGDLALLNAVQKILIERDGVNRAFVDAHTTGFDRLEASLRAQDMERLSALSGVSIAEIEKLAETIASADKGVLVWSMGITQHEHGADTVRAIADLGLLRGWVGREGCGLMPIRGHSGVQGGAEMGAYATAFPGGKPIDEENARALSKTYGFEVPSKPGLPTVRMIEAADHGALEVFYIVGGNFLDTLPQPSWVRQALSRVPVRVHQDIVLTQQMLIPPKDVSYILPARTRYEQRDGGTETTTERRVILSPEIGGHEIGQAMSEWEIMMRIGEAVRPQDRGRIHFDNGFELRQEIGRVVSSYAPIAELRAPGDQFQWGGEHLCAGGVFPLPDGKARLCPVTPPELTMGPDELRLSTRRGKQFNSMVQGEIDPLTGAGRRDLFFSAEDAARLDLAEGEEITLENEHGKFKGRVAIRAIRPGNVQGHWPEVNVLLPRDRIDPSGGVPDYNAVVRVQRTTA
jgi:molybdopterin-dependent oxidoreductase alpha subunit